MKNIKLIYTGIMALMLALTYGCKDKEYAIPTLPNKLQNDAIKRSIGPNLVGATIEFAYAMALPPALGTLVSAQVEANITGASDTYLAHRSYYTHPGSEDINGGTDIGIPIGLPSINSGNTSKVTFNKDTAASTLRYFYSIPESARGKSVSFKFSAKSSNGEEVSFDMGPYSISNMDMALNIPLKDAAEAYISIADMKAYPFEEASKKGDLIDLIYLYRPSLNSFGHALVSPAADNAYLPSIVLPAVLRNSSKVRREFALRDQQLGNPKYGVYIDDLDFQVLDLSNAPNYALNLKEEAGVWVETSDGKYRAYVFVNSTDNSNKGMTISIKRFKVK